MEGPGRDLGAGTDRTAAVGRTGTAGRVLDDDDAERVAQRPDRVEVDRDAALVDDDDRAGAGGERPRDRLGGQVAGLEVDVGEHRPGADVLGGVGGGDERERRDDDVVTGAARRRRPAPGAAPWCSWTRRRRARPAGVVAKASSKAATLGPWATQPERMTSATASTSSSPSQGSITLIRVGADAGGHDAGTRTRPAAISSRSGSHHSTSSRRPSSRPISARKPRSRSAARGVGEPADHAVDRALRPVLDPEVASPSPAAARRPGRAGWSPRRWRCCRPPRRRRWSRPGCWPARCRGCGRSPWSAGRRRRSAAAGRRRSAPSSAPGPRCRGRGRPSAGRRR